MNDETTTQADETMMALARAIWTGMRDTPEDESEDARKAAWKDAKGDARKVAAKVMRRLERAGFTVSKT